MSLEVHDFLFSNSSESARWKDIQVTSGYGRDVLGNEGSQTIVWIGGALRNHVKGVQRKKLAAKEIVSLRDITDK
jgi:hypothetical protein